MDPFWRRLLACERRVEYFIRIIRQLRQQVRELQQQLNDLRGTA
jgi:cell division septum initiation protein DivIVA